MKRLALVAFVAVLLTGCWSDAAGGQHPGNDPHVDRCALLDAQNAQLNGMGARLRCDPSYQADEQSHCPPSYRCSFVMEWDTFEVGVRAPTAWVWQANLADYWLQIAGWEGVCETYAWKAGRIPDYYLNVQRDAVPAAIEQECFSWAVGRAA